MVSVTAALPRAITVSVLLPLTGPRGRPPPDANLLRRGILQVLRANARSTERGDAIAASFHDDPGEAGHAWTISPPFGHRGETLFRLTAIGLATAQELADVLEPGSRLVPEQWSIGPLDRWRVCAAGIDGLVRDARLVGPRRLGIRLLSATAMSGARRGSYGALSSASLVEGWRRRWAAHLGLEHPLAEVLAPAGRGQHDRFGAWVRDAVVIRDAELVTARCALPLRHAKPAIATSGHLVLEARAADSPAHAALAALWRFSLFCGSGRHLTLGFGQTLPFCIADDPAPARLRMPAQAPTAREPIASSGIGALVAAHPQRLPLRHETRHSDAFPAG